ncbi:MAG TPA: carboxypeptidase-like regulatory domain-containing protein, partial [Segetibacter sp.]|nr:carboxypeptidase-like regulatory domain-containing protein [Segetibacter sp.]
MRRLLLLTILFTSICISSFSQLSREISGLVVDTSGMPLPDVYVKLVAGNDSVTTTSNPSGFYRFQNVTFSSFKLVASIIGYQTFTNSYHLTKGSTAYVVEPIKLTSQNNRLADVVVVAVNPVLVKEDTVEYKASAFKVREGAPVEDVIKKLPGVTVDKDGKVTAQGKPVARIRVNGKDYFGGDVQTATQNLPADIIENIQIIDDYGDKANITGIKEGEPEKILNITIQKGKNRGNFGNATIGGGTQGRYVGRISANSFVDDRQVSILGSVNNTNANIFNFNGGGRG